MRVKKPKSSPSPDYIAGHDELAVADVSRIVLVNEPEDVLERAEVLVPGGNTRRTEKKGEASRKETKQDNNNNKATPRQQGKNDNKK